MSRGACICSSASRSRRRFPTAAAARPAPAPSLQTGGAPALSLRHPSAAERPQPIIAWRAPQVGWFIFPIVAAPFGRPTAMSTQQAAPFGTQTPAAGFAPPTRHARPLIFSPHATYRRLISSYKFLLSPSLLPVAAPIALRSARSAIVLRAPGRFAPHSFPLHGGEVPTGLFFIFRFCPSSPLRPPPFRHPPPWRCPVRRSAAVPHDPPPRSPRNPDCAAVCPHPFTPFIPPIARAPRL